MTATIQTILLLLAVLVVVAVVARRLEYRAVDPPRRRRHCACAHSRAAARRTCPGIGAAWDPAAAHLFGGRCHELARVSFQPAADHAAGFRVRDLHHRRGGGAVHYVLGMPWAVGFVLGAIVAPTDAVAPLAIVRNLGLPRRLIVVLEGEGLANDATALILYRFAVAAVSSGLFSLGQAAGTFALIVVGEIAYGIGVGWASLRLRRWAHDPRVEITLSLLTPYAAFLVPQHLGGSGVLAAVAAGLFVSWNGPLLIPAATRLQGIFFWDLLVYLLEGILFLVTGMETRPLLERADMVLLRDLAVAVPLTVAVIVVARFVWNYPAVYLPRWLSPALARRDPLPPRQWSFLLAFVGVRGVVSLAAALAIPFFTAAGTPFPGRDLIIFVTFGVIIVTLIGQGLMLPTVVRWLALPHDAEDERRREQDAEITARLEALKVAQGRLDGLAADGDTDPDVLANSAGTPRSSGGTGGERGGWPRGGCGGSRAAG